MSENKTEYLVNNLTLLTINIVQSKIEQGQVSYSYINLSAEIFNLKLVQVPNVVFHSLLLRRSLQVLSSFPNIALS